MDGQMERRLWLYFIFTWSQVNAGCSTIRSIYAYCPTGDTWTAAVQGCTQLNMMLLQPVSSTAFNDWASFLQNGGYGGIWVGARWNSTVSDYVWEGTSLTVDGSYFASSSAHACVSYEKQSTLNLLTLIVISAPHQFESRSCTEVKGYICQPAPTTTTYSTTSIASTTYSSTSDSTTITTEMSTDVSPPSNVVLNFTSEAVTLPVTSDSDLITVNQSTEAYQSTTDSMTETTAEITTNSLLDVMTTTATNATSSADVTAIAASDLTSSATSDTATLTNTDSTTDSTATVSSYMTSSTNAVTTTATNTTSSPNSTTATLSNIISSAVDIAAITESTVTSSTDVITSSTSTTTPSTDVISLSTSTTTSSTADIAATSSSSTSSSTGAAATAAPNITTSAYAVSTAASTITSSAAAAMTTEVSTAASSSIQVTLTTGNDVCLCGCLLDLPPSSEVKEYVEHVVVKQIQQTLSVHTETLSSTLRQKSSADDERRSARAVGSVGIVVLLFVFGSILLMDITYCSKEVRGDYKKSRKKSVDKRRQDEESENGDSATPC